MKQLSASVCKCPQLSASVLNSTIETHLIVLLSWLDMATRWLQDGSKMARHSQHIRIAFWNPWSALQHHRAMGGMIQSLRVNSYWPGSEKDAGIDSLATTWTRVCTKEGSLQTLSRSIVSVETGSLPAHTSPKTLPLEC